MDILRAWLGKVFKLQPEDWRPLWMLQGLIVMICTVITASKTITTSLFVSHVGVSSLPYAYMASAFVLVTTGFFLIPLIDKLPRLRMYRLTVLVLAAAFGVCFLGMLAKPVWVYYFAYLIALITDGILFLEFWLLAQDLCDARQAKRIFPYVIGWSLIGGMLGAFGTRVLVGLLGTELLLLLAGALLMGTLILIAFMQKILPREMAKGPKPKVDSTMGKWTRLKMDIGIVKESSLVKLICMALLIYSVLAFLTDFLFNTVASARYTVDGKVQVDQLTAFYGLFDGVAISASLIFQFFLVNRILNRLGITNAQLILPGMFGLGFGSLFGISYLAGAAAAFFPALATRFGQKFLSSSIHRSSMTVLYSPIPSAKRGRSKTFAESIVQPFGVFLAGLLIFVVRGLPIWQVAAIALVFGIVYVVLMLQLRRVYLTQILKLFEERNFGVLESFSGMFARLGEKEIVGKLCDSLEDRDFNIRNFVVELFGQINSRAAVAPLIEFYKTEKNVQVKATVVKVLGQLGGSRLTPILQDAIKSGDARVRANAIEAIVAAKTSSLYPSIPACVEDPNPRVSANAWIALSQLKLQAHLSEATRIVFRRYEQDAIDYKLSALFAFGEIATDQCMEALITATRDPDKLIVTRAIASLGSTKSEKAAKTLSGLLPQLNTAMQNQATAALIKLAPYCPDYILASLRNPDILIRRNLIRVATSMEDSRIADALKEVAVTEIEAIHGNMGWMQKSDTIAGKAVRRLFHDTFEHLNRQAEQNVLDILRFLAGNSPAIQRIFKDLSHPDRFVRSSALDALETIGHKGIARAFMPILEHKQSEANDAREASEDDLQGWVRQWLKSPYRWIRACGIFAVGEMKIASLKKDVQEALSDSYELVRANALEAMAKFGIGQDKLYFERMLKDPSPLARRYAKELLSS